MAFESIAFSHNREKLHEVNIKRLFEGIIFSLSQDCATNSDRENFHISCNLSNTPKIAYVKLLT